MSTPQAFADGDPDRELGELEKVKKVLPDYYSQHEKVNRIIAGLSLVKLKTLDRTDFDMPEPGLDDDEMDAEVDEVLQQSSRTIELLGRVSKILQPASDAPHLLHESYGLLPDPEEPDEIIDISSGDEDDEVEEATAKEEDTRAPITLLIHDKDGASDSGDGTCYSVSSSTASTDGDIQILSESRNTPRDATILNGKGRSASIYDRENDPPLLQYEIECLGPYKFQKKEDDDASEQRGVSMILID